MTVLLVVLGGMVGAPLRYQIDRVLQPRHDSVFPWGTFTANVVGSFVLGVLAGAALGGGSGSAVHALVGTGFCGALTTYSTFGYETVRLFTSGARLLSALNVVASVAAGLGAAFLGYTTGLAVA
jgi:CrcB protein